MADDVQTEVSYRLPCSILRVSGSRETRTGWDATEPHNVASATVELSHEAERRWLVRLPEFRKAHDFEIKLLPDGRLAGASNSSRGLLGDIVEASLGVVSFAAGLVGAVTSPRLPPVPTVAPTQGDVRLEALGDVDDDAGETPAQRWRRENVDGDATQLKAAVEALRDLNQARTTVAKQAGETDSPAAVYRKLLGIHAAMASVEAQIAEINTRREAWYSATYVTTEDHDFNLPTDAVFRKKVTHLVASRTIERSELTAGSGTAQSMLEALGVAVVELWQEGRPDRANTDDAFDQDRLEKDQKHGHLAPGIWFRIPRSAFVGVYVEDEAGGALKLQSADWYWVVDAECQLGSFPLTADGGLDVSGTFSPDGVLQSLAMDAEGRLEAIVDALKAAPAQIAGGLEQAKKVSESWDTLRSSRVNREVKLLENRKKQLETAIATRGLEADAANTETLQQLKDRLERLKTSRDIGALESPPAPDPQEKEDADRRKLARRLRTDVSIELFQQVLAGFRETDSKPPEQ